MLYNYSTRNKQGNFSSLSLSLSLFVVVALLIGVVTARGDVQRVLPLRLLVHVINVVDLRGCVCLGGKTKGELWHQ